MNPPKPETTEPLLAVSAWKHPQFIAAQAAIVKAALVNAYISPSDVPETVVRPEDRQGVASNAWNMLRALGIIQRVPLTLTVPERDIYGGRQRNGNEHAKGRWCAVYTLASKALAHEWLRRNAPHEPVPAARHCQQEMAWV